MQKLPGRLMMVLLVSAVIMWGGFPGPAGAQERVTLEFWTWLGGERGEAWAALVEEFNAQSDTIRVETSQRTPNPENLFTALAAGVGPDIIFGSSSWTRELARQGALVSLSPLLQRAGTNLHDDILPGFLDAHTYRQELYAIPVNGELWSMYGNRVVLQQSGVAEPQQGWTWNDLQETLSKVVRLDGSGEVVQAGVLPNEYLMTVVLMKQAGARRMNEAGDRAALNSEAAHEVFTFIDELASLNLLTPRSEHFPFYESFHQHKTAFTFDGSQRTPLHAEAMDPDSFFVPYPLVGPLGEPRAESASLMIALPNTGNPEEIAAAWEVAQYFTSTKAQAFYNTYVKGVPPRKSSIADDAYQALLQESPQLAQWVNRVFPYNLQTEGAWPAQVNSVFVTAVTEFIRGDRPPVGIFLTQLHDELNAAFQNALGE